MGYYTTFELETDDGVVEIHKESISNLAEYCECFGNSIKWYEHIDDMKNYSKRFPNTLFTLYGEGEESEDLWVKYFKNGKVQIAKTTIVYEKFDESKLL